MILWARSRKVLDSLIVLMPTYDQQQSAKHHATTPQGRKRLRRNVDPRQQRMDERERRVQERTLDFMALAAHQLRTPLTAIRWALGRLERMLHPQESAGTSLRLIREAHNATIRMTETINTMLAISRIEAGKTTIQRADLSLHALLDGLRDQYRPATSSRGQSLHVRCPTFLSLATDPHFLKEILQNLLSNAIKYTPEHGVITVTAKGAGACVRIEIQDNGYGIPERQQDRIFTKFFRGDNVVDKETDGTGLGLSLVFLLTKVLGGTIAFRSEEGKGTTFTLELPAHASLPALSGAPGISKIS